MSSRLLIAPLALASLAGCNTWHSQSASQDPAFGEAVKYDMAVQTIDPDPVYAEDGAQPGDHGEKGAKAVDRYRRDAVKQLERMEISSGSGGSGGGSGPQ